jgi:hypothetical protein
LVNFTLKIKKNRGANADYDQLAYFSTISCISFFSRSYMPIFSVIRDWWLLIYDFRWILNLKLLIINPSQINNMRSAVCNHLPYFCTISCISFFSRPYMLMFSVITDWLLLISDRWWILDLKLLIIDPSQINNMRFAVCDLKTSFNFLQIQLIFHVSITYRKEGRRWILMNFKRD